MFERHITLKSHFFNEDRFVVSKCVYGVIDGATELSVDYSVKRKTSASVLSAFLKKELEKFRGGDISEYLQRLSRVCYEDGFAPASCGVALAVVDGNCVTFYCLGDCEIVFKTTDGGIHRLKQEKITELDESAICVLKNIAKDKGISIKQARPLINDILIKNRNMKNTPNGYDVFEPMEKPMFTPLIYSVDRNLLDRAFIFTDGFSVSFSQLGLLNSYRNLFDEGVDVLDVCKSIKNVLKADYDFNKFPRFKLVDDITVVELNF